MICNLYKFVSETIGAQTVQPYSMIGLVIVLYVFTNVSFCFPHFVDVNALMTLTVLAAFSLVMFMCSPKFSLGSKVTPRIFGCFTVGILMLPIESDNLVLNSD